MKYPLLRLFAILYRLGGIAVTLGIGLIAVLTQSLVLAFIAVVAGMSIYAIGEGICMLCNMARDTHITSEVLSRMYMERKRKER